MLYQLLSKGICHNIRHNRKHMIQTIKSLRLISHQSNLQTTNHMKWTEQSRFNSTASPSQKITDEKFEMFYRFPYINAARFLGRLKLYQTGFCVASIPPLVFLTFQGVVDVSSLQAAYGVCTFALIMLFALSVYMRRFIGIMALNENNTKLRISHLTFWGNRKDVYLDAMNMIPLSELPDKKGEMLIKLKRYDSKDFYFLCLHYGGVLDKNKFEHVFGKLEYK